ncbi:MAG: 16S rRNA (cytidine(1402)-2'-O)-methyltransferase [Massiliimalia sp.]
MSVLYVVGTPIGNLQDFSPRAVETLRSVDFIAAEDTRVTLKLLNHFDIKKPLVSYYEHNLRQRGEQIVERILAGETCAVVSDAGMPCISDPGEDLVKLCAAASIPVRVIPGPSAVISALAVSGLSTSRFTFEGFLSTANKSRMEHLNSVREEKRTMVFYEAPHKLLSTLEDMRQVFGGERRISLCREITKIYEEVVRMTFDEAVDYYTQNKPKGEFVLVIEGKPEEEAAEITLEDAVAMAKALVEQGEKATEAAKKIAKQTDFSKSDIYKNLI